MRNKIFNNVRLGKNVKIFPPVIIGFPGDNKSKPTLKTVIGENSVIRPFTIIYEGVRIGGDFKCGQHVSIRSDNIIGNNVSVGTNTVLEPGNRIEDNVRIHTGCFLEYCHIEKGVFIGPHVVFTDDPHPPCPRFKDCLKGAIVKEKAKIGANSTVLPGVVIGRGALVGAGSVVTQDVAPEAVGCGNPARKIKNIKDLKCVKGYFKKVYEWQS